MAAVSPLGWCSSLWSRNASVGPQAQVLTPIQVSRWQHIRRAFSWAAFLRTVAIINLSFLCCCCLFTGIDYLHPDLASNYVSTSQPVLGNIYTLNVLASLIIRDTHALTHTHACMHTGHAHKCTLEPPILLEPQLRHQSWQQKKLVALWEEKKEIRSERTACQEKTVQGGAKKREPCQGLKSTLAKDIEIEGWKWSFGFLLDKTDGKVPNSAAIHIATKAVWKQEHNLFYYFCAYEHWTPTIPHNTMYSI